MMTKDPEKLKAQWLHEIVVAQRNYRAVREVLLRSLARAHDAGASVREIAGVMGRSSSISSVHRDVHGGYDLLGWEPRRTTRAKKES